MQKNQLVTRVLLAILAAWAIILRLFDFPILPFAPFLKLDLSDVAVLLGVLVKGPIGAMVVAVIRDILNYIRTGGEAGIPLGAFMSVMASLAMVLPFHLYLKKWQAKWNLKQAFIVILTSVVSLTIVLSVINYFIALPIYVTVLNFPVPSFANFVLGIVVPFNIIKGSIMGIVQVIVVHSFKDYLIKKGWLNAAYHAE